MATRGSLPVLENSYIADEALTRYTVVVFAGSAAANVGHVAKPSASGDNLIAGVVQDDTTASGDVVRVMRIGKSLVLTGVAINTGQELHIHDADGRVAVPTAWSDGDGFVGTAEEVATASGDIISAYISVGEVK